MAQEFPLPDEEFRKLAIWNPMDTFPQDGLKCILNFGTFASPGWRWGHELIGRKYGIRGEQNMLPESLKPLGWIYEKDYEGTYNGRFTK